MPLLVKGTSCIYIKEESFRFDANYWNFLWKNAHICSFLKFFSNFQGLLKHFQRKSLHHFLYKCKVEIFGKYYLYLIHLTTNFQNWIQPPELFSVLFDQSVLPKNFWSYNQKNTDRIHTFSQDTLLCPNLILRHAFPYKPLLQSWTQKINYGLQVHPFLK